MKFIYFSLFLVSLFVSAAVAQPARDEEESLTKVGDALPVFSVTDTDGKKFSIADLGGKIIYINFWATWCPPCLEEMPRIEKEIWGKYKSSENFVMVTIAREETADEIVPFKQKYKYTFPTAPDGEREVYKLFGDSGIPRSYVVGANGKILFQSVGYSPAEFSQMVKVIDDALKKMPKEKLGAAKELSPKKLK